MPQWLQQKLHLSRELRRGLDGYRKRFVFTEHHESHAGSAFFPSPFEEAAILTLDGVGEWSAARAGTRAAHRGSRLSRSRARTRQTVEAISLVPRGGERRGMHLVGEHPVRDLGHRSRHLHRVAVRDLDGEHAAGHVHGD